MRQPYTKDHSDREMKLAVTQHEKIKSQYYVVVEGNLPELTGSPKQIKWAEDLRGEYLQKYQKDVAFKLSNSGKFKGDVKGCEPVLKAVSNVTNAHSEAKWWIENRNNLTAITATEFKAIAHK